MINNIATHAQQEHESDGEEREQEEEKLESFSRAEDQEVYNAS